MKKVGVKAAKKRGKTVDFEKEILYNDIYDYLECAMKFGLPTLVECPDLRACAEAAKKYGLDFIEINMSFPQYQTERLTVEELEALAEEYGIYYTIHADEQLNPFDFNSSVSSCYSGIMREYIRFAKRLPVSVINMHLLKGVYVTQPGMVILLSDVYREEYLAGVSAFIKMCEEEIGDTGLRIAIENVDSNPFTASQVAALELFMQSPVFGLTLDVGHDACLGGADRHIFKRYPDKLLHMHLHDSDGKSAHLPLGSASVDVGEKLDMLTSGQSCLVEVKTLAGLEESVSYLKKMNFKE